MSHSYTHSAILVLLVLSGNNRKMSWRVYTSINKILQLERILFFLQGTDGFLHQTFVFCLPRKHGETFVAGPNAFQVASAALQESHVRS